MNSQKLLLKNGLVYQGGQLQRLDLLLADGLIAAMGSDLTALLPSDCQTYDLQGKLVSPGLVDVHVHYREPGFTYKETIKTGTQAAAHGALRLYVQCQMFHLFQIHLNF